MNSWPKSETVPTRLEWGGEGTPPPHIHTHPNKAIFSQKIKTKLLHKIESVLPEDYLRKKSESILGVGGTYRSVEHSFQPSVTLNSDFCFD